MSRKLFPVLALLIALSMVLAACGGGAAPEAPAEEAAPVAEEAAAVEEAAPVEEAAAALKLTAQDLLKLNIIDGIIPEPRGGAHRDVEQTASNIKRAILREIETLKAIPLEELLIRRKIKYRTMGKPRGEVDE